RTSFFEFHLGELSLLLVLAALFVGVSRRSWQPAHWSICVAACALQLMTVILVFSRSPSRQARYFLPAVPCASMLLGWAVAQLNNRLVTSAAFVAFAAQFLLLHAQSFNIASPISILVRPLETRSHSGAVMRSIVARTCTRSEQGPSL